VVFIGGMGKEGRCIVCFRFLSRSEDLNVTSIRVVGADDTCCLAWVAYLEN
jgi:hypothetical protein